MSETKSQFQRRKYPRNNYGQKAEWSAVEDQKQEIKHELQHIEKEVQNIKKNSLVKGNDQQLQNHYDSYLNRRNQQLVEKQYMDRIPIEQQQNRNNYLINKVELAKDITEVYNNQVEQKFRLKNHLREDSHIRDYSHLNKNADILDLEQNRYHQVKFQIQRLHRLNQNNLKKEQKYYENVLPQYVKRKHEYQDYIQNKIIDRQEQHLSQEPNIYRTKEVKNQDMVTANDQLLELKQFRNQTEQIIKKESLDLRMNQMNVNNQVNYYEKQNKQNSQQDYKKMLDEQVNNVFLEEKMNSNYKQLNSEFLQSYKNKEVKLHQYIPGMQPQFGGLTERERYNLLNPSNRQQRQNKTGQSAVSDTDSIKSRYINEKEKLMNAWLNPAKSYGDVKWQYNHNPIISPVPQNNQNPYIQKTYRTHHLGVQDPFKPYSSRYN